MNDLTFMAREIWHGKSVVRAFCNARLKRETLRGKVIDVGGGKNADYIAFMPKADGVDYASFDVKAGAVIDFEQDVLPAKDNTYDTVLFLNVLEHIYNHKHILKEVYRITKEGGKLIGIVPFLMWYHADPKDFFRYTHEALEKIFIDVGIEHFSIEPLARGPFTAAVHMFLFSMPRLIRVPIFGLFYFFDTLFLSLRPKNGKRYALGYYFVIEKSTH